MNVFITTAIVISAVISTVIDRRSVTRTFFSCFVFVKKARSVNDRGTVKQKRIARGLWSADDCQTWADRGKESTMFRINVGSFPNELLVRYNPEKYCCFPRGVSRVLQSTVSQTERAVGYILEQMAAKECLCRCLLWY